MDFQGPKKDWRFKDGDMESAIDELETGSTETDFGQTWEEPLEAFTNMPADLENEVKSSAASPGNEPAVVSAPAPRPSLLKKLRGLNKVHPLVKTQLVLPKIQPVLPKIKPVLPKIQPVLSKIKPVLPKIKPVLPKIKPVLPKIQQVPLDTPSKHEDESLFSPFAHPHSALDQSFRLLRSDNWENRMEGLNSIRRLAPFHPNILTQKLHSVCLLVVQEVQSLRSQVSRVAVATLGELYHHLRHAMDPELDWTAKTLLQKAGESNRSIREEVDVALLHMRHSCTPSCALKALINWGLSDHNVAVRECAARHIKAIFKSMGTTGLLCCRMGDMDSFLSAICRMCQDTSQEVRNSGIKLIWVLEPNQDLNKKLWKMLP
ncbi:hypothetical protein SKAU_G00342030 [Synaphobranchus kaupii]|uniref:TOG domain-containing protein n=1 Tax=Synaphobranchus kaupii TaxID=118154 RepID=A0A9Q1IJA9_SYNKA|nr:hypothetical protein SKAU_G00342030 [Synaphobranchus kaupii]